MMANWIRTFTVHLFLAVCILGTSDIQYTLSKYCNKEHGPLIHKGNLLVVNEGQLTDDQCEVQVNSDWTADSGHDNDDWLMILIQALNMPCNGQTRLQFFNRSTSTNDVVSYPTQICSDKPYQTWYLIKSKTMVIRITAATNRPPVTIKLLATATSFEKETAITDFICRNQLRIDSSLKCDGDNNCGDFSDEVEDGCRYTKWAYLELGLGLGLVLGLPYIVAIVVVGRKYFKRKARAPDGERGELLQGNENAGQQPNAMQLTDIANPSQPSTNSGSHHQTRAKRYQNAPSSPANSLEV